MVKPCDPLVAKLVPQSADHLSAVPQTAGEHEQHADTLRHAQIHESPPRPRCRMSLRACVFVSVIPTHRLARTPSAAGDAHARRARAAADALARSAGRRHDPGARCHMQAAPHNPKGALDPGFGGSGRIITDAASPHGNPAAAHRREADRQCGAPLHAPGHATELRHYAAPRR
jgi:hypothetical protein